MNTETENTETKMQFILDENKELQEIPKDKCKPVEYPIRYRLKNAFEVFVREENARESKEVDELVSYTYGQKRR